jgi:hypothetical protein
MGAKCITSHGNANRRTKGALSYDATKADPAVDGTKAVNGVVLAARLGVTVVNWFVAVMTPDVPTG